MVVRLAAIALASNAGYVTSPTMEVSVTVIALVVVVQPVPPMQVVVSAMQSLAVVQAFATVSFATSLQ